MKSRASALLVMALSVGGLCADQPPSPLLPCRSDQSAPACNPSKKELKKAREAYSKGLKLQSASKRQDAFDQFETAARLVPRNLDYLTTLEMARQQLVFDHVERGNNQLLAGGQVEALAEFGRALQLDPQNTFAQQRLQDASGEWAPKLPEAPRVLADAGELRVQPRPERMDFHYRGDSRGLLTQIASAFGVTAVIDDSVVPRRVRFDLQDADFYVAMRLACDVTHSFWTSLEEKQVFFASESPENRRQFDRIALRTFYVPGISSPQEMTDIVNMLRNLLEIRFITPQPQTGTLVVRAPMRVLDAATQFIEGMGSARPQVMLDVHVYEISHSLTRNMGVHIPNQFQMFNVPAGALAALGGQNIQDLINQLISSGGINQANQSAISALLAQLQGQQNSIFSQPVATFGNGLTLMGVSLGTLSAQLSLNESSVKNLEHATLRAAQGNEVNFRLGTRFPILNASFAPVFNTPAISQVLQNNTFQAAFPSFNYEDIGLTVKAKPTVNGNQDVALQLEMQLRSLTGTSINGVPVISNREYKGSIVLTNGEPAIVAGSISHDDKRSMDGVPGFGIVPGLNKVITTNSKGEDDDELLVVITPHVVKQAEHERGEEVWMAR